MGLTVLPLIGALLAIFYAGKARHAAEEQPYRFDYQLGRVGRILGWIGLAPIAVIALVVLIGLATQVVVASG